MKRCFACLAPLLAVLLLAVAGVAQQPRFRVLAFHSPTAELDHVQFAESALKFFGVLAEKDSFIFDSTTDWADLNPSNLKKYQIVVWLTDSPANAEQRLAFQQYMEGGGAWLGFHAAGYNDKDTNWPCRVPGRRRISYQQLATPAREPGRRRSDFSCGR